MRKVIFAVVLALPLSGCLTFGELGSAFNFATTSIGNPVTATNVYQVKNGYAVAAELAVEYRRYCWSASYKVLMTDPVANKLCKSRRPITRAIMAADQKAFFAVSTAENFVRDNPTLSAASVISAAVKAVTDFRNVIPTK